MFKTDDYWEEEFKEIKEQKLNSIYFEDCIFINCDFANSYIQNCKFSDCKFISCDLSLSKLKSCVFNDVCFENSKLIGISWSSCDEPFNVKFDNCNISQNSFHLLDLRKMKFINSIIKDSGFEQCNLQEAIFDNCDLEFSDFYNNNLKKANFETSRNYLINPQINDIEKAIFSLPEALSFLKLLPIVIK
ncbi:hypothetical protein CPU12_02470 [Malaciobacter molluscorum LMG 25693]|uniref:Pentapeptide repeat-containing protein n=1 Tax=Malaciobacter molluscorum LMG 25693 TaxID=870501 RepID=A0A2G1DKW3_9BACT|nr:pentapeptide repeat-containing protein [Malaciobacter molluscorum]AXX92712.1 pentapeptide repeat-containing protein [Malaciobacter molluscorum LMG 25693]PHO19128.1 hypothetical protein CPU12_02470 [Malaciobacter molluscorum LMG 25693]